MTDEDLAYQLGPFVLTRQIGQGGMGAVYRAEHRAQRVPVAIKLLFASLDPEAQTEFEAEVAAIAGLDHRAIVQVVDTGVVVRDGPGPIRVGARYLAMELASLGSLSDAPPSRWAEVLHVATAVLEGLAHAHARGLVHRDIKLGNVLLCSRLDAPDVRPRHLLEARPVLSDFGLTVRQSETTESMRTAGTPRYMSPEQVLGHVPRMGPWTDIYQAGVLFWRMVTGDHPIKASTPHAQLFAHLTKDPGKFEPQMAVPDGLEAWLRICLAKGIHERFATAAEALEALRSLSQDFEGEGENTVSVLAAPDAPTALKTAPAQRPIDRVATASLPQRRTPWNPTSVPTTRSLVRDRLAGSGLGLLGLREVGPFGREEEQQALWERLVAVHSHRTPATLLLTGSPGSGRSRLARWAGQAAGEEGAAFHIELGWSVDDPDASARILVERLLMIHGVEDEEERDTLATSVVEAFGQPALSAQVHAAMSDEGVGRRARFALIARLLGFWSEQQVVVLTLYNGADSAVALQLMRRLQVESGNRTLVLATGVDPPPESVVREREALVAEGGTSTRLGPLSDSDQLRILRSIAELEAGAEEALLAAAGGFPGALMDQLGTWVRSGQLEAGPRGYRAVGELEIVPLTDARFEQLARSLDPTPEERLGLAVASVLRQRLLRPVWARVCSRLGTSYGPAEALLVRHGLVLPQRGVSDRWNFAHPSVADVFAPAPAEAIRIHTRVAEVLAKEGFSGEHVAEHLLEAGRPEAAYGPLYSALCQHLERGEARSERRIELFRAVVEAMALPPEDPRWGDYWIVVGWQALVLGDVDAAEVSAVRAERDARRHGWTEVLIRALRMLVRVSERRGELHTAVEMAEEALGLAQDIDDRRRTASLAQVLGRLLRRVGEHEEALGFLEVACEIAAENGLVRQEVVALEDLGSLAKTLGELDEAQGFLEQGREKARAANLYENLASIENLRGELLRKAGDLQGARDAYGSALALFEELGVANMVDPVLNLALLELKSNEAQLAYRRVYRHLGTRVSDEDTSVLQLFIRVVLLAASALLGRAAETERHHDFVQRFFQHSTLADPDVLICLELAARGAGLYGDQALAGKLDTLAEGQKARL